MCLQRRRYRGREKNMEKRPNSRIGCLIRAKPSCYHVAQHFRDSNLRMIATQAIENRESLFPALPMHHSTVKIDPVVLVHISTGFQLRTDLPEDILGRKIFFLYPWWTFVMQPSMKYRRLPTLDGPIQTYSHRTCVKL